jgi:hypothetical protein
MKLGRPTKQINKIVKRKYKQLILARKTDRSLWPGEVDQDRKEQKGKEYLGQ